MIKQAIQFISATILGFGLVAGCGATQDDASDDTSGLNGAPFMDPLGSIAEAFTSSTSQAARIIGNQTGTLPNQGQCVSNPPSGATCHMPVFKTNWVLCDSNLSALGKASVSLAAATLMNVNAGNFTFSVNTGTCLNDGTTISFFNAPVSGPVDSNLDDYSSAQFTDVGATLTESLPGTYKAHSFGTVIIDETKLASLGGTSQIQKNRDVQVIEYQLGKLWGLGSTGCGSATPHPSSCGGFADGEVGRPLLPVQKCLINNFVVGGFSYSVTGTNCGTWPSGV